jgi:hypothetical protein
VLGGIVLPRAKVRNEQHFPDSVGLDFSWIHRIGELRYPQELAERQIVAVSEHSHPLLQRLPQDRR